MKTGKYSGIYHRIDTDSHVPVFVKTNNISVKWSNAVGTIKKTKTSEFPSDILQKWMDESPPFVSKCDGNTIDVWLLFCE